jgi:hypothetical protein
MNITVDMQIGKIDIYDVVEKNEIKSVTKFKNSIKGGRPFVFDIDWPAVGKWSPEYLSAIAGDLDVPVSMSVSERSQPTIRKTLKLDEYIDLIVALQRNPNNVGKEAVPYLKQFDLLSVRPELHDDIEWSFLPKGRKEVAFWLGTKFSMTGLHTDPNNGVLAQIYGSKRIFLFSPDQREFLYPNAKFEPATHCCDVDAANPDYRKHPKFFGARGMVAEISKGQALFIPKGWYHQVMGLENNISINCFFFSYLEYMTTDLVQYRFPKWLHDHGLYKRGNCVCHNSAP